MPALVYDCVGPFQCVLLARSAVLVLLAVLAGSDDRVVTAAGDGG